MLLLELLQLKAFGAVDDFGLAMGKF